jgi:folate-binding protein YgfZ
VFRVLPGTDQWLLLTADDIAASVLGKLRMFVLRADVLLTQTDALEAHAIIGDARAWLEAARLDLAITHGALHFAHGVHWLRIGPRMIYAIGAADAIRPAIAGLDGAASAVAELGAIRCGIPRVDAALIDRYIPQMLNLDVLGAISFDKGCYPGQEVITRTHNLGTVKRKMRRFTVAGGAVPESSAVVEGANGEPAGEVVRAAPAEHGVELLAVVRLDALSEPLRISGSDYPLAELPLPYQ